MIDRAGGDVPFSCDQMFDLAADIACYPEFLKGWISARVVQRQGDVCHVEQVMGAGPIRIAFVSSAVLRRPDAIEVTSTDPVFRHYRLAWSFTSIPGGCRIDVEAEIELASRLRQRLLRPLLQAGIEDAVAAFRDRAYALYAARE
jgi:coenzyme Q-binding protein COQ10